MTATTTPVDRVDEHIQPGTAMGAEEMQALAEALDAGPDPERMAVSLKLLGIKPPKVPRRRL